MRRFVFLLAAVFSLAACNRSELSNPQTTSVGGANDTAADTQAALVRRGKSVYLSNCIACHASDPAADGSLGPAVHGSSLELLRLRILELKYPEGYKPKRKTQSMVMLPHLKNDIEALHAYLNE